MHMPLDGADTKLSFLYRDVKVFFKRVYIPFSSSRINGPWSVTVTPTKRMPSYFLYTDLQQGPKVQYV